MSPICTPDFQGFQGPATDSEAAKSRLWRSWRRASKSPTPPHLQDEFARRLVRFDLGSGSCGLRQGMAGGERAGKDPVDRPLPNAPARAGQLLDHQALATDYIKIDRLVRPVQQLGIMPRQPAKISPADAQLFRRGADISAMFRQDFRDAPEIEASATQRELRNERHRPPPAA
jgi:hypothetical protein